MTNIVNHVQTVVDTFKLNLPFVLGLLGILWGVQIINCLLRYRLNVLGVYPRSVHGFLGIVFTPFLHGSFSHLILNSVPLFVFMSFVLLSGRQEFYCVTLIIILLGGFLLWLFGRKALHVGASSLLMGYFSYLLIYAYFNPSILTIVIAFTCIYYFGGLFLAIFPVKVKVSWEGHLFGFIAGLAAVYLCPFFLGR